MMIRFIPAGAGNTTATSSPATGCSVHPRWRGEHVIMTNQGVATGGSSPLARGTRGSRWGCSWVASVHPRWRGEHASDTVKGRRQLGSSPLARGTRGEQVVTQVGHRFIPAGAGNTLPLTVAQAALLVHPRWRGEHLIFKRNALARTGSSPLARGTRRRPAQAKADQRFIPAGAGNTPTAADRNRPATVHPRWRGEHGARRVTGLAELGSSPLARGTPKMMRGHC